MSATKQVSVRLPLELAKRIAALGPLGPYILAAVTEKLQRDDGKELEEGYALLAASPEMWDMDLPTGGQCAANTLFCGIETTSAS